MLKVILKFLLFFSSLFLLLMTVSCKHEGSREDKDASSSKETTSVNKAIDFTNLFNASSGDGISCYRIPALLKAQNGVLIAAIDERNISCGDLRANKDINIVMRKSADGGLSWSEIEHVVDYPLGESASDPSMILDATSGAIFLFFNYMDLEKQPNQYYLQYVSSIDNGSSWSEPIDITNQITKPEWQSDFKFITSGRGIQTSAGTLLHTLVNIKQGLYVFGSRNHGKDWFLIDTPILPGDESKIVELTDGSWMINSRVEKSGLRYIHTSLDEGVSWKTRADSALIDPTCNASLIRYTSRREGYSQDRLLFCNPSSSSKRENLELKISYDEGETWKYSKTIYAGQAAYASLCILENGDIGVFFEKDDYRENVFARMSLAWLTDGQDAFVFKE